VLIAREHIRLHASAGPTIVHSREGWGTSTTRAGMYAPWERAVCAATVGSAVAIRVVVAEDNLLVREGIVRLLSAAPDIDVVRACADYDTVMAAIDEEDPDVVLTDMKMPPTSTGEGVEVARRLRSNHPKTGVVVVSQYSEPDHVLGLFEDGADRRAYLLKERLDDRAVLLSAIRSVAAGGSSIDSELIDVLLFARAGRPNSPLAELTPREREVLAEIAKGKSNSVIADEMGVTKRGIEKHVNSIFLKLALGSSDDVSKRVKATLIFLAEEKHPAEV
jgi:DNA-binding NarL/FixJ family response regulator